MKSKFSNIMQNLQINETLFLKNKAYIIIITKLTSIDYKLIYYFGLKDNTEVFYLDRHELNIIFGGTEIFEYFKESGPLDMETMFLISNDLLNN
ncbi:hypothetical protein [[Clostridium] fimetarium]|uniref:Uncharacterized protein n=1 Tax=[Clostridium] fimetarium TaxID=99656 RepID=A0A1I0QVL0_9FIRM|nr:hypothetical protein [[Clostridium] fimetarium]SEW31684.1 hypothetical protein SAMN05421659_109172 [[Clostridium] fimetarium]